MSRADRIVRTTRRRSMRRGTAVVTAVVILAVMALIAYAGITRIATAAWPSWLDAGISAAPGLTWMMPGLIAAEVVLVLLGIVLIAKALRPGRLRVARLTVADSPSVRNTDVTLSRRGIARLAAARADEIDGVDSLSTTATGRRVVLKVDTRAADTAGIREAVRSAVAERLAQASLQPAPRVKVEMRSRAAS